MSLGVLAPRKPVTRKSSVFYRLGALTQPQGGLSFVTLAWSTSFGPEVRAKYMRLIRQFEKLNNVKLLVSTYPKYLQVQLG